MINRISMILFQAIIGNRIKRRAVSFAILMKHIRPASVIKDWSYKQLARESGLSRTTCTKYIHLLQEMKLVSVSSYHGHNYLYFKKLKEHKKKNRWGEGYHTPRHRDVILGNYDPASVKTIERHLAALVICETQRRKDYCQQSISTKTNPKSARDHKRADRVCRARGWDSSYTDNGISYKYIERKLHCSPNTVSATIKYGEEAGLFTVTRCNPEIVFYGVGEARLAAEFMEERYSWCSDNAVFYQPANRYTLLHPDTKLRVE